MILITCGQWMILHVQHYSSHEGTIGEPPADPPQHLALWPQKAIRVYSYGIVHTQSSLLIQYFKG